ncbi:ABC transporter substrate-binding protein [Rhizobium rhizogenes]|jgi:NitT/TauT family transport system substrate-binding protein|uniref:ABC transporter substrate-binding protein n=1 Tax=Rhizobium rhizogenes TaxID=359 RepID=UPI0004D749E6|nr:ABC transporter substrate-binding protein [Rhizobium rhizogenes]KEA03094.1 nitrate ABC transporter ATPase [Rhizobium rhizogenes]NTF71327.1 ABC transporter substrate-binding protein [Rhizobium rhizogenes]NTI83980.1 ABC transporter substrate-binding protein [Rhizobium rhizogenes]NTJ26056.1 ABC transporter substrate-binding protein [Rhizobium rhizogenes]QUE82901.1 ABC transporter substrate-binding protein [Rhizobium rhizogenes]
MRNCLLAATAAMVLASVAHAEPVRMSVGSYNLNNLPFPVAESLGFYKEEGLEVTTENFAQGGSKVLQALVAGSTDVAVGFYDHTIQMQSQGKHVIGFVQLARNSGLVLVGKNDTDFDPAKPATIKGKSIGITAPGSSSDFFIRYYLQQHGLTEDDISIIGVGSGAAAVAALQQGKVDLLVNYDPAATIVVERGIGKILIDARSDEGAKAVYGGIYPTSVLYANQAYIEAHPEVIQKVTNATVKALHWMRNHSAAEIVEQLPDDFVSGDKATYIKAVENAKAIFSKDGLFVAQDTETPLAVLKSFNEGVHKTTIDLNATYTNKFVEAAAQRAAN